MERKTITHEFNPDVFPAGKFKNTYESPEGQEIWEYLTRPYNIEKMILASNLQRAAVDGVHDFFNGEGYKEYLKKAGHDIDWVKKMVGTMAKYILDAFDYVPTASGKRCVNGQFFKTGTTYGPREGCPKLHS